MASYRRRHQLAEEVPGLYIRRLTLEDPRSAREASSSRSQSPPRHICHPTTTGYAPSSRRFSRYFLSRACNSPSPTSNSKKFPYTLPTRSTTLFTFSKSPTRFLPFYNRETNDSEGEREREGEKTSLSGGETGFPRRLTST